MEAKGFQPDLISTMHNGKGSRTEVGQLSLTLVLPTETKDEAQETQMPALAGDGLVSSTMCPDTGDGVRKPGSQRGSADQEESRMRESRTYGSVGRGRKLPLTYIRRPLATQFTVWGRHAIEALICGH